MGNPWTLEQAKDNVKRYAPIIRLHPDEKYLPCSIEWYLARATLMGPRDPKATGRNVAPATMTKPVLPANLPSNYKDSSAVSNAGYRLIMDESAKPGNIESATAYAHVRYSEKGNFTDIEYWIFYAYNGPGTLFLNNLHISKFSSKITLAPCGEHWTDWEQVTVRIDAKSSKIIGIYLSQHSAGEWITTMSRFQWTGDQPHIYPSLNGHANYCSTGDNPTEKKDYKIVDFYLVNATADGGKQVDYKDRTEIIDISIPNVIFPEPSWVNYAGSWAVGQDVEISKDDFEKILAQAGLPNLAIVGILVPFLIPYLLAIYGAAAVGGLSSVRKHIYSDNTNGPCGPKSHSDTWNGNDIAAAGGQSF